MADINAEDGFFVKAARVLLCAVMMVAIAANGAEAAKKKKAKRQSASKQSSATFSKSKYAALVIDADTGRVLHADQADEVRYPASLTKMMTVYLAFESLAERKIGFSQEVRVSDFAAGQSALDIQLQPGDRITIDEALSCTIVRSANDAAVVLAEAIAGSEDEFARRMTAKARELGMTRTKFANASGLPDENQVTTARDMAILGLALKRDFPAYYPYFKREYCSFDGRTYRSHNRVTMYYDGADGIKTGYIRTSGYNLVSSASKNGMNLVGVVMGGPTASMRDEKMISLLNRYFEEGAGQQPARVAAVVQRPETGQVAIDDIIEKSTAEENFGQVSGEGDEVAEVADNQVQQPAAGEVQVISKAPTAEIRNPEKKVWGIQVGAYNDAKQALKAAKNASSLAKGVLGGSKIKVASEGAKKQAIHRARVVNLTYAQASKACRVITEKNENCFVGKFGNS